MEHFNGTVTLLQGKRKNIVHNMYSSDCLFLMVIPIKISCLEVTELRRAYPALFFSHDL